MKEIESKQNEEMIKAEIKVLLEKGFFKLKSGLILQETLVN